MPGWRVCLLHLAVAMLMCGVAEAQSREIRITRLAFEGVDQIDEGDLRNALETRQGGRAWLPWGERRLFDRRAFEADLQRIEAFYRDRGFPDARVTSFDLSLNDPQDQIAIVIHVSEGEPVRAQAITIDGLDDLLAARQVRHLRRTLPLQEGQPLDRQLVLASRERVVNALRDAGYPYARVSVTDEALAPREVGVRFEADPGIRATFGSIEIVGTSTVDEHIVRRQLTFREGDLFTRQKMRASQRRLFRLELFEFVNVESLEDLEAPVPDVPARVTVVEGDHQRVTFGIGYGSEERARVRLRWEHANLFGGARHLGFEGKWSWLDRGIRLDYREPYFFHPHLSLSLESQAWQAAEPVYSVNSLGGRIVVRHQSTDQNVWSLSLINEYQRSVIDTEALLDEDGLPRLDIRDELIALGLDPRTGFSEGTVSALALDVSRTTVDQPLDARSGYVVSGRLEQAGRWLWGSFNYLSFTGEGRHYWAVGRTRAIVLANRLRFGAIRPLGEAEASVPFHKRFFLGGASSLRGWGRFEVSPTSGFGLVIGGYTMLEGSTEVRFPIRGSISGAVFTDYGNVWPDVWDVSLGDLRYAAGAGIRYRSPVGPVRFDWGYQLNPIPGLLTTSDTPRRWRVHLSIGQAF
jgi:outer membrane protein assembly complex protein YaeT